MFRAMASRVVAAAAPVVVAAALAAPVVLFEWKPLGVVLAGAAFAALMVCRPFAGLLVWVVSAPLLDGYLRIGLGAGVPDLTFTRLTVVLGLVVVWLRSTVRLIPRPGIGTTEKFMLAFLVLSLASVATTGNWTQNLQLLLDAYLLPFAFFFLARRLVTDERQARALVGAVAVLGAVLAVIGCAQYFGYGGLGVPRAAFVTHADRAHGPFTNSVEYGAVMVVVLVACVYLLTRMRRGPGRLATSAGLGLAAAGILFSLTRGVWLSAVAACGVFARYARRVRRLLAVSAVIAAVGLATFLVVTRTSPIERRAAEIKPLQSRMVLYATALRSILDRPVLGYGFDRNAFREASRDHLTSVGRVEARMGAMITVPHNEFLNILIMLGGVGLVLYGGVFVGTLRSSLECYRRAGARSPALRDLAVLYWAVLATFVTNGLFVDMLFFHFFNALVFVLAGTVSGLVARGVPPPERRAAPRRAARAEPPAAAIATPGRRDGIAAE